MVQSVVVYSFLIAIMLLCAVYAAKKGSVYPTSSGVLKERGFWSFETLVPLLLFSIVFGMRYDVGKDHLGYLEGYLGGVHISKGEPLFDLFSNIGWGLNMHVTVYFGV